MTKKVMVAMSGGVDSSVAALLLKQQGYDVVGITMQIWPQPEDNSRACCSLDAIHDARRVAWNLGIPHYVLNFRDEFQAKVIDYFCQEYLRGRTPNPCIACNRYIKFESLLQKSLAMGADYIATGHYARNIWDDKEGKYHLLTGLDHTKDQSYALYTLTQFQLAHTLFPLGEFKKEDVRKIARNAGLPVSDKPESQEICFVPDNQYAAFIDQYLNLKGNAGEIKDQTGKILGSHQGIHHFTIGQRKGLGLALGYPAYVSQINAQDNVVWVGKNEDLYQASLVAENFHFISGESIHPAEIVTAKIRYLAPKIPAAVTPLDPHTVRLDFEQAQRAITPGQAVVLYQGDMVLGGGIISTSYQP